MAKKTSKYSANIIDPKKYRVKICCYDLFKEIWDEHPKKVKELPILTVISIVENDGFYPESPEEMNKYSEQIKKYFNPSLEESIIDIQISNITRNIVIDEGLTQFEAENRDFYYLEAKKWALNKDDLHRFYFSDYINYDEWDRMDYSVAENLCEYLSRKIIGIQPSIKLLCDKLYFLAWIGFTYKHLREISSGNKDWFESILETLNNFKHFLPKEGTDAFNDFVLNSYRSVENKLKEERKISICRNCGKAFAYKEDKIYCLPQCRKKSQRRRYYLKYGDKIKRRMKNYMRLLRKEGDYIDKRRYFKNTRKGDTERKN